MTGSKGGGWRIDRSDTTSTTAGYGESEDGISTNLLMASSHLKNRKIKSATGNRFYVGRNIMND